MRLRSSVRWRRCLEPRASEWMLATDSCQVRPIAIFGSGEIPARDVRPQALRPRSLSWNSRVQDGALGRACEVPGDRVTRKRQTGQHRRVSGGLVGGVEGVQSGAVVSDDLLGRAGGATRDGSRARVSLDHDRAPGRRASDGVRGRDQVVVPVAGDTQAARRAGDAPQVVGQSIAFTATLGVVLVHESAAVGLVEVSTSRLGPSPTHSVVDGHDSFLGPTVPAATALTVCQAPAPPLGLVEVMTWPSPSVATHSETDGQEIPASADPSTLAAVHAAAPPVGSVEVTTLPESSMATQRDTDGQSTLDMSPSSCSV